MEECYICYNRVKLDDNLWVKLICNHKMCKKCFKKLEDINTINNIYKCPFCRQNYRSTRKSNNLNTPQVRPNINLEINLEISINFEINIPNSRLNNRRIRRRRRNLSMDEIKERRDYIKKKCKKKWTSKDKRLKKLKWYEID